jgi:hypothetical protein
MGHHERYPAHRGIEADDELPAAIQSAAIRGRSNTQLGGIGDLKADAGDARRIGPGAWGIGPEIHASRARCLERAGKWFVRKLGGAQAQGRVEPVDLARGIRVAHDRVAHSGDPALNVEPAY